MVDFINIRIQKKDIIYDDKVKTTYNGQGVIRLRDEYLGHRAYAIFPMHRKNETDSVIIAIDEILNKGVHSNNDHTTRLLFSREYVGRKCIVILQEG